MKKGLLKLKYLLFAITILASGPVLAKCFTHEQKYKLQTDDKFVCGSEGVDYQVLSPPANFEAMIAQSKEIQYWSEVKDKNGEKTLWFKNININMKNPWKELAAPACQDRKVFLIEELIDGEPTGKKSFAIMRNNIMYGRWLHCDWPSNIPDESDKPPCDTIIDSALSTEVVEETIIPIKKELEIQLAEGGADPSSGQDSIPDPDSTPDLSPTGGSIPTPVPTAAATPETETDTITTIENEPDCGLTSEGKAAGEWDGEKCVCVEGYENSDKNDKTSWCDLASFKSDDKDDTLTEEEALKLLGLPQINSNSKRPSPPQMRQVPGSNLPQKIKRGITRGYR